MATRFVLMAANLQLLIWDCYAVNGIIWHKQRQEFVQLFSIPQFAVLQKENLAKLRAMEKLDMKGEVVKAVYYEEKNMVMFQDNDTRIDGIFGQLWYLLQDYLNFTFIPIKSTERNFGKLLENGSHNGLLGILERNEAQVIMRSTFYFTRMNIVDYTTPLWQSTYHIYVHPEWLYDNTWVFTLFSWQTWFYIVFLFIILSCVGYFLQKVSIDKFKHKRKGFVGFSLGDHFFYSFTIMSARGCIPNTFYNKFKILTFSKSIFAWLTLLAFSSHLIYRMTYREQMLPFKDIDSLINNTKYILLMYRGSPLAYSFNFRYGSLAGNDPSARIRFIDIAENMHRKICSNLKKYALFECDDRYMALSKNCQLRATVKYNVTWVTLAFQKNYPYRKNFDYAIIKFREVGLIDDLKDTWFNIRLEDTDQEIFNPIDVHQVYLIFLILYCGILISFVILILENITNNPVNLCNVLQQCVLLLLAALYRILQSSTTMNGVIWSKTQKTFVPISSVPTYAIMQQDRFRQSRGLEIHNFQLQNFTLTSFQNPHFLHFYNNNTKVTGLCGEVWNLLSESLNFTLLPVKANVDGLGMPEKDRSFKNGLLGIIFRNETMAIPKLETFISRLAATEFSVPFWINRIQLYIHPEVVYDNEWIIKIFCYIPEYLNGKSRILEVSLGLFCSIIYMSFGALLFIFLSKSGFVPPFDKFESLVYNTKFSVITLKDSIGETLFILVTVTSLQVTNSIVKAKKSNRLIVVSTIQEMHKKICSMPKKYAMFQTEETHKVTGEINCHLINIGEEFIRTWVTSGIIRNFKYKRTIDIGIQLYIHPEMIYDNIWMVKIFSWKIWCVILSMCLLLSLCTFLTQSILIQNKDKRKNVSFNEHLFYSFGNLCNQGYIPQYLDGKSRMLEVSLGLFCSVICMSFGAVLFIHLSKSVFVPPFDSFTTLVTNTKYNVIGLKGSTAEAMFKINEDPFLQAKKTERLMLASTFEDMHKMACFSKKEKYVIFQTEAMYKVIGNIMCHLTTIGEPYAKTWVTSGIVKNFKYKRSIDLGILKLMEIGLLNVLKKRWLENNFKHYYAEDDTPKPIELHQVSLIIAVMCCGTIIALIILIIEKIIFAYKLKQL
ncbi:putative glutamate receptor [Cyphomyrmex costatus]|uniref:Putative glutamate receptor n=1 Tax=Cyphomyrmex costatus TaxID=456900 RepID=A0A195CEG1_9HYME|nr:putative glutamate receptor [Cyphomyrmex costatus]